MSTTARIIKRTAGAALLLVVALAGCGGAGEVMDRIAITTDKEGDRVSVTPGNGDGVVIDVTSPSGISGLTATAEAWPEEVVVRLRLRGLERLEIRYGNVILTTGVSSTGDPDPALMLSVVDEDGRVQSASPSADIYYPDIRIVGPSGGAAPREFPLPEGSAFEIALPAHFHLEEYPSLGLQWIDFYR